MVEYVTRDEFEARVGVLEHEVDGEKLVTRHILEQTRRNGDDLAAVKTRLDRVETELGGPKADFRGLKTDLSGLVKSLPTIVREAVRDAFREHDRKKS